MSNLKKLNFVTFKFSILVIAVCSLLSSCGSYRQNIMFKPRDGEGIGVEKQTAEANYIFQKNDVLELEVFTNQGEKIVDPNYESFKNSPAQPGIAADPPRYLVDNQGLTKLPLLEEIKIEGLSVRQAEGILQKEYAKHYQEPFVVLKVVNRRVTVLGSPGGKVIPLADENVRLTEILALAGGINMDGKARNIRVLRGEKIFVADLSTTEGYLRDNMLIQSGDIIYVEPVRRPFLEGLQSYGPLFSILTSLAAVTILIITRNP